MVINSFRSYALELCGRRFFEVVSMEIESKQIALISLVDSRGRRGIPSSDITKLYGSNQFSNLRKLENAGVLKSLPTGRRDLGRRWFTIDSYAEV